MATVDAINKRYSPANLERAAVAAINAFALIVANELKTYPPLTDANAPGRFALDGKAMGYYERGRGWWSPRVNIRTGSFGHYGVTQGRVKGSKSQQIAASLLGAQAVTGYKLTGSSERLREKWKVTRLPKGARIANSATYAPYVQSHKDQSAVMARIGWTTDKDALNKVYQSGEFHTALKQALEKL